jgi:hypothetical protein
MKLIQVIFGLALAPFVLVIGAIGIGLTLMMELAVDALDLFLGD